MHCPSCGNESPLDQKFCRKCGFGLAPVGELMRGTEDSTQVVKLERAEREALIVRQMFRWIARGMIVLGLGVLMLIVNKSFGFGKFFGLVASLLLLTGTAMAAYGVISAIGKGARMTLPAAADKKNEIASAPTKELAEPGSPVSMPSVTERTTALIGDQADLPK